MEIKNISKHSSEKHCSNGRTNTRVINAEHKKKKKLQNLLDSQNPQFERDRLLSIFDGINEIVYVTDLETNEILYMNKFAKGIAKQNPLGKVNNKDISTIKNPTEFGMKQGTLKRRNKNYRWEYHNPVLNRDYLITDRIIKWPDGRDVRFELAMDITERKKVEHALKESEELLQKIFDASPACIFVKDSQGKYLIANKATARLHQTTPERIRGETDRDHLAHTFATPEEVESFLADDREVIKTKKPKFIPEEKFTLPDGTIKWFQTTKIPLTTDKHPDCVLGIAVDITKRKKIEETLATRLRYEESLARCSQILLTRIDSEKSILEALSELLKVSGASRVYIFENFHDKTDGLCTRQIHEVCAAGIKSESGNPALQHAAYKNGFSRWDQKLSKGEKIVGLIKDFPKSEREVLEPRQIISILVLPIRIAGKWCGFIGFDDTKQQRKWNKNDIRLLQTAAEMIAVHLENKWTEEILRESEERFRTVADFTYNFEYWISPDGDYIYVSPSSKRVTGYSADSFLADPKLMEKIVHPEDRQAISQHLQENLDSKEVFSVDFRITTRDGQQRWISHVCQPVYASDGQWLGRRASNRDITERKAVEKRLVAYQNQLKSLASELLLAEEHEKRRLAVGLHDQIGQKLALTKLALQSLMKSGLNQTLRASLDNVSAEIDQIIEDIHSLTFELSNPVLYELGFEAAVEQWLIEHVQKKHGIECVFTSHRQPLPLDNKVRIVLFQAVRELLINIVKHAQAKTAQVHIQKNGNRIQIFVMDDGVGFKHSKYEASSFTTTSGFGLFSTRERLEYIGGDMKIESMPGSGTCVTLSAPLDNNETKQRQI